MTLREVRGVPRSLRPRPDGACERSSRSAQMSAEDLINTSATATQIGKELQRIVAARPGLRRVLGTMRHAS